MNENTHSHKESFYGIGTVEVRPFRLVAGEKVFITDKTTKHNLIVLKGRETLIDLLVGFRRRKLQFIRFGKGGAPVFPDGDPLEPFEVADADTDVAEFLIEKPLSPYRRLSATEVEYVETLISDEVNSDVNEAAMFFTDLDTQEKSIFARITFPTVRLTIEKGTGIEVSWVFNFNSTQDDLGEE